MKTSSFLAIVLIGIVILFSTGGATTIYRMLGTPNTVPDSVDVPNATFMGDHQSNPFVTNEEKSEPVTETSSQQ